MNLFHKLSAALIAAALAAGALLSIIFFSFQRETVRASQQERLAAMTASASAILSEAELAGDPLMAVDYLSGLYGSPGLVSCELDIGRGLHLVRPRRGKPPVTHGKIIPQSVGTGKFSARLDFSADYLEREIKTAMAGIYRNLAAAFLGATAAAGLFGVLMAWRLTGRLKRLAAKAADLGEGRFGTKADVRGSDEVADLAAAFNRMSERLLELETMKKNFTASVTHELRSPLGVIETYAAMLIKEEGRFREEDLEVFRRIKENAGRLANFVTAMLDLAKIERGKMELRPSVENPLALTRDTADFLRPKAGEKGVALVVISAESGGACLLDRELITHALSNLISNAVKFTPAGGKVEVRAAVSGGKYRVEVQDTGPGLKAGEGEKLFAPYAQGSAAQGHGGTGLGLALAKSIIEMHKGAIGCSPAPGGGALFWFEIPAGS